MESVKRSEKKNPYERPELKKEGQLRDITAGNGST